MRLAILSVLVLSACGRSQHAAVDSVPAAPTASGRVVSKIDPRIWCIYQDRSGDYWFGSNGSGLYRFDGQRVTHYDQDDGLRGLQVRDIQGDARGHLLVAFHGGVDKFDGERFTPVEVVDGPADGSGWVLNPDDIWMVADPVRGAPCRYDGKRLHQLKLPKSPVEDVFRAKHPDVGFFPTHVFSIYRDRRGHMWFGTAAVGVYRFDGQQLSWMHEERLTTTSTGGGFGIRCVFEDRSGEFWISNTRQRFEVSPKVEEQDGIRRITYSKTLGLPDALTDAAKNFTYFAAMTEDESGAVWLACGSDGVLKYDGEDVVHYVLPDGGYALEIYRDQGDQLWVGTVKDGIYLVKGSELERFKPPQRGR